MIKFNLNNLDIHAYIHIKPTTYHLIAYLIANERTLRQILKGLFPGLTGVTPVDIHGSKEFCVDVSQYKDVTWVEREGEMCTAEFEKVCEDKKESVCGDVTETKCEVEAYPGQGWNVGVRIV